jgi:GAF domain-containing protein
LGRKRHFAVIESRQMDHLRVFHEVARALTQTLELEEILLTIMEKMAQFFGPERWSMLMVDEAAQQLYYAIAVGENSESLKGLRIKLGEGVAGWVASTGNPLVVPDVSLDPQWNAFARAHPDLNIQSIACVPVRSGDKTLGVIQLLNSKLDLLSEYSISFLRILCDYAAIAIQNSAFDDLDPRADDHGRLHQSLQRAASVHDAGGADRACEQGARHGVQPAVWTSTASSR